VQLLAIEAIAGAEVSDLSLDLMLLCLQPRELGFSLGE
jgi:hypothetical protein